MPAGSEKGGRHPGKRQKAARPAKTAKAAKGKAAKTGKTARTGRAAKTGKAAPAPRNPVARELADRSLAQKVVRARRGKGSYDRKSRSPGGDEDGTPD
ncbi:MAG: hypothetical protein R3D33_06935 [Hyphomicrobiaceae bacterium]